MKKSLVGLQDNFCHFVPCSNCHKLYQKNNITEFHQDGIPAIMKCRHVEYPNSTLRKERLCETPLFTQTRLVNGKITNRPNLIYLFTPIQQQLAVFIASLILKGHFDTDDF